VDCVITLDGPDGPVRVGRTTGRVLEVHADTAAGRAFGLGWGHAQDRIVQLAVLRIAGRGRAAELLDGTDSLVSQDRFIRRRGFAVAAETQAGTLTPRAREIAEAYAAGINRWLARRPRPLELLVLGVKPEPWTPADSLLIALLQSYLGLAQSQEVVERFIAHVGRSGDEAAIRVLRALFAPHLDHWDPALLAEVQLEPQELTIDPLCAAAFRAPVGSNGYAVPPSLSTSGRVIVAGEPHLDASTLPPSFHEAVLRGPDTLQAGVTVPGVPGVLAGRWTSVAGAITYGFLDQIDLFVEEVRAGRVRRGDGWAPLERRDEVVRRKGSRDTESLTVWRSDLGLILGDPTGEEPSRVLALRWILDGAGMEDAFAVPFALEAAGTVDEARDLLAAYPQSFQYALGDVHGAVGLQQCGLAPRRAEGHSGLNPVAGWDPGQRWTGSVAPKDLVGFTDKSADAPVVTANQTTNRPGRPAVVTLGLSSGRKDRIAELLKTGGVDQERIRAIQQDRQSAWARAALDVVRPRLPDTDRARTLAAWDGVCRPDSTASSLFWRLDAVWLLEVYGALFDLAQSVCAMPTEVVPPGTPEEDLPIYWSESNSVTTNVPAFREALLDPEHAVFAGRDWEAILDTAITRTLARPCKPWGEVNRIQRTWFLLAGTALGRSPLFSRPVTLPGAMDAPEQGRIHRIAGRVATVSPVWRMVADLGERALHTALAGGPSDRLLGPRRTSDLARFDRYALKTLPLD